ncbi:hypothetical protein [Litorilituus lipolyticus]|uniref:hypothetical protein n=1 Tax=Litorilituus lipolyticus TaxID=2491017 RepID=UPI001FEBCEC5|nr:hypothetical protein [Litorilituus lipolyticus]
MVFYVKKLVVALMLALTLTGCATEPRQNYPKDDLALKGSHHSTTLALTVEELRLNKAMQAMPDIQHFFDWAEFKQTWPQQTDFYQAKQVVTLLGDELWQYSKQQAQLGKLVDDRPLYWTRLGINAFIKQHSIGFSESETIALVELFENVSRGRSDLAYRQPVEKRILLTGFDPFLLDRNIEQSNPSGLAALLLDGTVIEYQGEDGLVRAEINTAMIPVRYEDFEQGEVESLLAPFYAVNNVDLIATISMGRKDFDLEHFPGLRRSAKAPDNVNVYTGASKSNPIVPKLSGKALSNEEFVLFSLPVKAMQRAKGPYKINDNKKVTTMSKTFSPQHLNELSGEIAVEGGGGGYLSNEISYRSILLRNKLSSSIPTGHIHTPRIKGFDKQVNQGIFLQIKAMLTEALSDI